MEDKMHIKAPVSGSSRINMGRTERIISAAMGSFLLVSNIRKLNKLSFGSLFGTLAGGYLVYRSATGHCAIKHAIVRNSAQREPNALEIRETMTINRPRNEVYRAWRALENLPYFMKHLASVKEVDGRLSHWEANIPGGLGTLKWDAEIVEERMGELLVWRSVKDAMVDNAGELFFKDAPGGRGTELQVNITYRPPAGELGHLAAKMLNKVFDKMIREDIRRFKQMMETGEMASLRGQPVAG